MTSKTPRSHCHRTLILAEQITAIIVHLRIKAPKLAHILLRCCSFEKTVWPNENSIWRAFFKMAPIDNTVITAIVVHLRIKAQKLAHILLWCCCLEKTIWPNENSRWRPFFKMAAIDNTVITAVVIHLRYKHKNLHTCSLGVALLTKLSGQIKIQEGGHFQDGRH